MENISDSDVKDTQNWKQITTIRCPSPHPKVVIAMSKIPKIESKSQQNWDMKAIGLKW